MLGDEMAAKKNPYAPTIKKKKVIPTKFDREGFLLFFGMGVGFVLLGSFLGWATYTAPEGFTESMALTTSQRLTRMLPDSTKSWIALIMSGLFVLFGVFCLLMSLKIFIKFMLIKMKF
jgi:ABC-type antimicrobial peptide transport system permease subunit